VDKTIARLPESANEPGVIAASVYALGRHSSAMLDSPRRPFRTMRIFAMPEACFTMSMRKDSNRV
jgi:hypothetical protein